MNREQNKIELLSPAGDLEKLKVAAAYGADAIYIGGQALGLRAKARNFDLAQMETGIEFAHDRGVKVYVTSNIFAHNDDFDGAEEYFKVLYQIGADALIISDPGIFALAREAVPDMEIHISTQANNTNYKSALFWQKLGASRIVLARELSFGEIREIYDKVEDKVQLEAFVHGAMCISYSGRCLLSSFMAGRDANKGECAHPCRWKYSLVEEKRPNEHMPVFEDERGSYIFNSKDLCMLNHIPDVVDSGIYSLKIEGRMKTPYYVAAVTNAYREAIDDYYSDPARYESKMDYYMSEIRKSSHRDYTTGFFYGKPTENDQVYTNNSYIREYDFVGIVNSYDDETGFAVLEQRNKFVRGDEVEFLRAKGENFVQTIEEMLDVEGNEINEAPHAQQIVSVKVSQPVSLFDIMRKKM